MVTPRTGNPVGRPKGVKDSPLAPRQQTAEEKQAILEAKEQMADLALLTRYESLLELRKMRQDPKLPPMVKVMVIKTGLESAPMPPGFTLNVGVLVEQAESQVSTVRDRLSNLHAVRESQSVSTGLAPYASVDTGDEMIIDAEIVDEFVAPATNSERSSDTAVSPAPPVSTVAPQPIPLVDTPPEPHSGVEPTAVPLVVAMPSKADDPVLPRGVLPPPVRRKADLRRMPMRGHWAQ